jgi:hypothetical protein
MEQRIKFLNEFMGKKLIHDESNSSGRGRWLVQTGPEMFTDSFTGESFNVEQVNEMGSCFKNMFSLEKRITGTKKEISQIAGCHFLASKPYISECVVNESIVWMFLVIDIPEFKAGNNFANLLTAQI